MQGCANAILDEFCLRTTAGEPVGWVFGLSAFSLRGEHIGWFEGGIFFDVDNRMLGFIPALAGRPELFPIPGAAPAVPPLSKRPTVPTLRARPVRQANSGWSGHRLATYLARAGAASTPVLPPGVMQGFGSAASQGDSAA